MRDRSTFLGASEIAAILGLNPWRTPGEVLRSKLDPDSAKSEPSDLTDAGNVMEGWLIWKVAQLAGGIVAFNGSFDSAGYDDFIIDTTPMSMGFEAAIVTMGAGSPEQAKAATQETIFPDPERPHLGVSPDALIERDDEDLNIDAKAVFTLDSAAKWGAPGTCDVPVQYGIQLTYGTALLGLDGWVIPAFIGPERGVHIYEARGEVWQQLKPQGERLIAFAHEWWQRHVVRREPLPKDGSDPELTKLMLDAFPPHAEREPLREIAPDDPLVPFVNELISHDVAIKHYTKRKELAKQALLEHPELGRGVKVQGLGRVTLTSNGQLRCKYEPNE